jgi:hypothetical protein
MEYKYTTTDNREILLSFEHNQGYSLKVSQISLEGVEMHSATNIYGYGYTGFKQAKNAFESVSGVKLSSLFKVV